MAQKRMFDRAIIDTDRFMDLSLSSKALYFLMGMEADDEGFVSYKKVMRIHGGNEDDIRVLLAKEFIIKFESGVVVITDWNKNNYLQENRIKPTEYTKEKKLLDLTDSKEYVLNTCLTSIEESRVEEKSIEENSSVSVIKKSNKKHFGELEKVKLSEEEYSKLIEKLGEKSTADLLEQLDLYISSTGKRYKSHYATILAWSRRKGKDSRDMAFIDSSK